MHNRDNKSSGDSTTAWVPSDQQHARGILRHAAGHHLAGYQDSIEVYQQLGQLPADAVRFAGGIRRSAASAAAFFDAGLGRASALEWIDRFNTNHEMPLRALEMRWLACLMQGDAEQAERCKAEVELLALRTNPLQLFNPQWRFELLAAVYVRDLAGVKRVIDAVAPMATRYPGWLPLLRAAEGYFELFRGDLPTACAAFSAAIRLAHPEGEADPPWHDNWCNAIVGLVTVLIESKQLPAAIELAEASLARCSAAGVDVGWHRIALALAIAEAKQGRCEVAAARVERVIAAQRELGCRGLPLADAYAARTSIAIWARDAASASRFAALTRAEPGGDKVLAAVAQPEALFVRARDAGLDLATARTDFEASLLGMPRSVLDVPAAQVSDALRDCADKAARAARVLERLCELMDVGSGQLYLVDGSAQLSHVASRNAEPPGAETLRFARGFFAQQLDDECFTAGVTEATHMLSLPGTAAYVDPQGREHRLLTLTCKHENALVCVGLAVVAAGATPKSDPQLLTQLALFSSSLLAAGDTPGMRPAELSGAGDLGAL